MQSVNKATILRRLGRDPEIRSTSAGKMAGFTVATNQTWRDRASGATKAKTQWHRVVVFSPHLVDICEKYLRKGSQVYLEGQLETASIPIARTRSAS